MATFERFVSRRYLFSRERKSLVSFITFISIAGVTVGVAALIIVIGVIDGIDRDIIGKTVEIYPHLKVMGPDKGVIEDTGELLAALGEMPDVVLAEPVIHRQVMLSTGGENETQVFSEVIGVRELGAGQLYNIPDQFGRNIQLADRDVLLNSMLMAQLGVLDGQRIIATTGVLVRTPNGRVPVKRKLNVLGRFNVGMAEFDAVTSLVSIETARKMFKLGETIDYVHVKLAEPLSTADIKGVRGAILARFGDEFEVATWQEENGEFFQALKLEKLGLSVILLLVVIVGSFNIIGTLILTVIEKRGEIGILKAIGASDGMIRSVFMNSGMVIGIMGTALGLTLGLLGCWFIREKLNLPFSPQVLALERLPVVVKPVTVTLIVLCSLAISFFAGLFPASQAARLDPVAALRHD